METTTPPQTLTWTRVGPGFYTAPGRHRGYTIERQDRHMGGFWQLRQGRIVIDATSTSLAEAKRKAHAHRFR